MGVLTERMADAAREAGATVRCDAEVQSVLTKGDRAVGVRLVSGEEITATRVLSNADPKRTFLGLCADAKLPTDFVREVEAYSCMGTSIKINLGLSALPHAKGQPQDGVQPYHRGNRRGEPVHRRDGPAAGPGGVRRRGARTRTSSSASRPSTTPPSHPRASTSRPST